MIKIIPAELIIISWKASQYPCLAFCVIVIILDILANRVTFRTDENSRSPGKSDIFDWTWRKCNGLDNGTGPDYMHEHTPMHTVYVQGVCVCVCMQRQSDREHTCLLGVLPWGKVAPGSIHLVGNELKIIYCFYIYSHNRKGNS